MASGSGGSSQIAASAGFSMHGQSPGCARSSRCGRRCSRRPRPHPACRSGSLSRSFAARVTRRGRWGTCCESCGGRCGATGREAPVSRLARFPASDAIDGRPCRRIARGERLLRCFLDGVLRRRLRSRRWCLAFHSPSIRPGRAASIPRDRRLRPRGAAARAGVAGPPGRQCDRVPAPRTD